MKLLDVPLGLLINFHEMEVTEAIRRLRGLCAAGGSVCKTTG